MKTKLKGGNAAVRFLLAHGEKVGMAAILACAGLLMWSALGVSRLETGKDPATLTRLANEADQHVKEFTYESISEAAPEQALRVKPLPKDAMKAIAIKDYPNIKGTFNPDVIPPVGFRTDPELLAAEDLEVYSDSGLWATADPTQIKQAQLADLAKRQKEAAEQQREQERIGRDGEEDGGPGRGRDRGRGNDRGRGDEPEENERGPNATIVLQPRTGVPLQGFEDIQAQAWVTVLAKVPIEAQFEMYEDSLEAAKGYNLTSDEPKYLGYFVERAEVTTEGEVKWERKVQVTQKSLIRELETYPVDSPEVVDSRYVHPLLTPLILKEWDYRASHSSMPLAVEAARLEAEKLEAELEQPLDDEPTEGDEGFGVQGVPREGQMPGEFGGRGEMDGQFGPRGGGMQREFGGGRGYGDEYGLGGFGGSGGYGGEMGGMRGGYGRGAGSGIQLDSFTWDRKTSHVLLRFFDNSVTPGHRYRYRVQLALADVNNSVPVQYLDQSVTDRREKLSKVTKLFRLTEWSKPSPIASAPLPARIYLASVEPPKGNSQPEAEILIKALDNLYAAEIALLDKFARGSVMNLKEKAAVIWSNRYDSPQDPEFDFLTGATVIDLQGGEKLSTANRDLIAPGRMVLMDAAGKMTIQEELQDTESVQEFKQILEQGPEDGGRGGFGSDGLDGGGGRGGRGGRGDRGGF